MKRLLIAFGLLVCVAAVLAYQSMTFGANRDALHSSLRSLAAGERSQVEKLIETVTDDLTKNEESGVVYYYDAAGTEGRNRVFMLWQVVPVGTDLHRELNRVADGENEEADLAMVVHADFGFNTFRGKYDMVLSNVWETEGLRRLRGHGFAWDESNGTWKHVAELDNGDVLPLLSVSQKKEIARGIYNKACVADGN